jgi:hypothetical protein
MRTIALCLIISATLSAALCQAQITPVVAKQRTVSDVLDSDGNVVSHIETLGRYLRNSAGSTVTQTYSPHGGETAIRWGQLEDYGRHKLYQLNYEKREAVELGDLFDGPHPEYLANAKSALGEETVNGFPCLIHSVYMITDGKKYLIGKKYDSAKYGLQIKEDAIIEPPGGPRTHQIVELYDIQFVDPDPKEFEIERFSFMGKGSPVYVKPDDSAPAELLK